MRREIVDFVIFFSSILGAFIIIKTRYDYMGVLFIVIAFFFSLCRRTAYSILRRLGM